jgi:hypothetical protein
MESKKTRSQKLGLRRKSRCHSTAIHERTKTADYAVHANSSTLHVKMLRTGLPMHQIHKLKLDSERARQLFRHYSPCLSTEPDDRIVSSQSLNGHLFLAKKIPFAIVIQKHNRILLKRNESTSSASRPDNLIL